MNLSFLSFCYYVIICRSGCRRHIDVASPLGLCIPHKRDTDTDSPISRTLGHQAPGCLEIVVVVASSTQGPTFVFGTLEVPHSSFHTLESSWRVLSLSKHRCSTHRKSGRNTHTRNSGIAECMAFTPFLFCCWLFVAANVSNSKHIQWNVNTPPHTHPHSHLPMHFWCVCDIICESICVSIVILETRPNI